MHEARSTGGGLRARLDARAGVGVLGVLGVLLALAACGLTGCVERDPFSASDVAAADAFQASQAAAARARSAEPASGDRVTCRCDAEGGLHVQAPQGATVTVDSSSDDAAAVITLPERAPGTRLRHTVSLGFAGDGKLTDIPPREVPWAGPDGSSGYFYGYGRGAAFYPSRGRGYVGGSRGHSGSGSRGSGGGSAGGQGGGSRGSLIFSPHVHAGSMGGGARSGSPGSGGRGGGHGPR